MLVGRAAEQERLRLLLTAARAGKSSSIILRGEPGIGKSALCEYAVEQSAGMAVLRTRGIEAESELAFSGLAELFCAVLEHLEQIPPPQAAALAGALAIGPTVGGDRLTICAATLSLLAAVAEDGPVLAVVDDSQWVDRSSLEAVLFAARRLDSEGVAVVFALREGRPTLFDRSELTEIHLLGLDDDAAAELLERHARVQVAPEIAARILAAAAGNPLALIEIPAHLTDDQLRGQDALDENLPTPPTLARAFLRHVDALPTESRQALLVAAASESGDIDTIARALVGLHLDLRALEPVEEAGLVSVDGTAVEFRHPLLRSAVYEAAPAVARRAAHQALAQAASGDAKADRRAWHRAAAAPADDDEAAAALEATAHSARARGGYAEAASAFERAAGLSSRRTEQARRLREAARDHWLAGRLEKALELLVGALAAADDPVLRARIQHLRGTIEMWQGSPLAGHARLVTAADEVAGVDPSRGAAMLTDAAWACFMAGDIARGLSTADRACAMAATFGGAAAAVAGGVRGIALALSGHAHRAVPLFGAYERLLERDGAPTQVYQPFRPDGQVLTWFEEYERARDALTRTTESARAQSALGTLPYALALLSDLDFRTGKWIAAYAEASEAARIAEETRQTVTLAFSLTCLVRVEAAQGRSNEAREHAARALEIAYPEIGAVVAYARSSLGLLELGLGRNEQAIVHLEHVARDVAERGLREPAVIQWTPDLIEAYVRAKREGDAERLLHEFEQTARETERTWALATAARCRALLVDDFVDEFERALELHDRTPTPFERARTGLCFGERLRRAGRRIEAREPLAAALDAFERLGAVPWAERARAELAATGETARRRQRYAAEELTPQELQVALVVARGATNKETGAALFLSPKTIETHLGRIYRKLNVRSRTELARLFATEAAPAARDAVREPTPVRDRVGRDAKVEEGRSAATRMRPVQGVQDDRNDRLSSVGDRDRVCDGMEEYVTGARPLPDVRRVLATLLFTDIVGSTERAAATGDRRWRELVDAHHTLVRRELERWHGREIDTAGDGFFASFDGPARAIRCARAATEAVRALGLEIRSGVHMGEVEQGSGGLRGRDRCPPRRAGCGPGQPGRDAGHRNRQGSRRGLRDRIRGARVGHTQGDSRQVAALQRPFNLSRPSRPPEAGSHQSADSAVRVRCDAVEDTSGTASSPALHKRFVGASPARDGSGRRAEGATSWKIARRLQTKC